MCSWLHCITKVLIKKQKKQQETAKQQLIDPIKIESNLKKSNGSRLVTIIDKIGLQHKTWYVKRKKPNRQVRGGLSQQMWKSWKVGNFIYTFGLVNPNDPDTYLFACADLNRNKVVLSQPSFPPNEFRNSDNRLFRHYYSPKENARKLQHVASGKFVAMNQRNRLILTYLPEEADNVYLNFH